MCAGPYTFANSVELDEMACNEPSHMDLYCLPFSFGFIMKTFLYNFDHLKPLFYMVNLRCTGYALFFFYFCSKHRLRVVVRTPRRGSSNECSQSMFWAEIWKISEFLSENSRHCTTVSQYQLEAPVTTATGHLCLTQPPHSNFSWYSCCSSPLFCLLCFL